MDKRGYRQVARPAEFEVSQSLSFEEQIPFLAPRLLFKSAFHSLALYWVLKAIVKPEGLSLYNVAISALLVVSVACFAVVLVSYKRRPPWARIPYLDQCLLFLIIAWFLVVIVRGIEPSAYRLFTLVANPEVGGVVWLLPLAAFIGARDGVFGSLLCVARVHMIVGTVMLIGFVVQFMAVLGYSEDLYDLYDVALALMYGAPLILLLGAGSKADRHLAYGSLIIYIIGAFLLSRRAPCVIGIVFLVVSVCIGDQSSRKRIVRRLVFLVCSLSLMAILVFYLVIPLLPPEWFIDTRSFLWTEMKDAFSGWDWIVGRGALGTYYSPYFQHEAEAGRSGDWMIRQTNEVGYLFIALKAGLIGVALYVLGFALTMRRAVRLPYSRFGMGVVAYFAIQIVEAFVIGRPEFIMEYIAQWILVGFVLSLPVRQRGGASRRFNARGRQGLSFSPPFSALRG